MDNLVFLEPNKIGAEPFTTSDIIADCAQVKHHAVQQLISQHEPDFKEFGVIAFEMRKPPKDSKGGRPEIIYRLNEQQATLLMTYLKNTVPVRKFKKSLYANFTLCAPNYNGDKLPSLTVNQYANLLPTESKRYRKVHIKTCGTKIIRISFTVLLQAKQLSSYEKSETLRLKQ